MCIFLTSNTIDVKVLITGIYTGTQTSAGELFKSRASHRCSEQDTTQVAIKATTLFKFFLHAHVCITYISSSSVQYTVQVFTHVPWIVLQWLVHEVQTGLLFIVEEREDNNKLQKTRTTTADGRIDERLNKRFTQIYIKQIQKHCIAPTQKKKKIYI